MKSEEEKNAAMTNPFSFTEAPVMGIRFIKVKIHILRVFLEREKSSEYRFLL